MRRFLLIAFAFIVLGAISLTSCSGDDTSVATSQTTLSISSSELSYEAERASKQITINCNTTWKISSSESWCTLSSMSGNNSQSLDVTVSTNSSTDNRSCTLTISTLDGKVTKTVSVTQKGTDIVPALSVSVNSLSFDASGSTSQISVKSNTSWTIDCNESWCNFSSKSGSKDQIINVTVSENANTSARSCSFTISTIDKKQSKTVTVSQKGKTSSVSFNTFFPLYGITIGKTTVSEMTSMGYSYTVQDSGSKSFKVKGVWFYDSGTDDDNIVDWACISHTFGTIPENWKTMGMDLSLSYDEWADLFSKMGFTKKVLQSPTTETWEGRKTLYADVYYYSSDNSIRFRLYFRYENENGEGYSTSSKNTLNFIGVDKP